MTSSAVTSGGATSTPRPARSRRSNLAVPGSSPKMLDKARGLPADQVFMDICGGMQRQIQAGSEQQSGE